MAYKIIRRKNGKYYCVCGKEVVCDEGSFFAHWLHIDNTEACQP